MSGAAEPCCGNCQFWKHLEAFGGWCRRYPPQVLSVRTDFTTEARFPLTSVEQWCGEHRDQARVVGYDGKRLPKPDNLLRE